MKYLCVFLAVALSFAMASGTIDSPSPQAISSAINSSLEGGPLSYSDERVVLAMGYLLSCQNEDGGFGADLQSESDIKDTSLAMIALASAGKNLSALVTNGNNPLDYLLEMQEELDNLSNVEANVGRYVVALASAGLDPRDINGKSYVQILQSYFRPDGGVGKENYVWDDAWVILGMAAANESGSEPVRLAVEHIKGLQSSSGGWSWQGGKTGTDPDTTGIIVCALLAGGEDAASESIGKALDYLRSEQNSDGGISHLGSNAASDGWAILAIRAAGQNPEDWKAGSADPISHLLSLQKEYGAVWWKSDSEGTSFEWTANMILALAGGRLPPVVF